MLARPSINLAVSLYSINKVYIKISFYFISSLFIVFFAVFYSPMDENISNRVFRPTIFSFRIFFAALSSLSDVLYCVAESSHTPFSFKSEL
jgi:hypothetical protein